MFPVLFITLIASASSNSLQNRNVETHIDASTQFINVKNLITVQNVHSRPELSYVFIVDPKWSQNISFITAFDERKQSLNINKILSDDVQLKYEIKFYEPILPSKTVKIEVSSVINNYLQSYPKSVKQGDKHLVLFPFNVYYYSLYFTHQQTTFVHLGTTEIISINGAQNKSSSTFQNGIRYGPYSNMEPMSQLQSVIHFENRSPFISVEKLQRFIQISHWGYIQVKEDITIKNTGPRLKGPFERKSYLPPDTRIESFTTALPRDAFDVYLKDEIGLLWSFHTNNSDPNNVLVNIKPRFVLYGGWKTQYQITYSLPVMNYVEFSPDNTFSLKIPLVDKIFPEMFVKEAGINIILPEGATPDIQLANNIIRKKYCYFLDIICREVVYFERNNLIDEHAVTIQLIYFYPQLLLLVKPLITAGYIYIAFILFIIFNHTKQSSHTIKQPKQRNVSTVPSKHFAQAVIKNAPEESKNKKKTKQRNRKH